jgi:hypothetical protein
LSGSLDLCDAYNDAAGYDQPTRVEYVRASLPGQFPAGFRVRDMSGDSVCAIRRMVELYGSDLASKREARNCFVRLDQARIGLIQPCHVPACLSCSQASGC